MARASRVALVALVLASLVSGCSKKDTPTSPSGATLTSITITGPSSLTTSGQQGQLTATANFSDGSKQDVTTSATWQTSATGTATVSASGVVTAVGSGSATITVSYQGKSATFAVTISLSTNASSGFTATIDGASFVGLGVTTVRSTVGGAAFLGVGGASGFTGNYILLALGFPAAVGTYNIGSGSVADASMQIPNQNSLWSATATNGGTGTITVTSSTANSASGTFSLTLVPLGGTKATGNKIVTNGVFNVKF